MAHLIAIGDSYTNFHMCFKLFMAKIGQRFCKSKWGIRIREIKLYDIVYPEEDEKIVFGALKHFKYNQRDTTRKEKIATKLLAKSLGLKPIEFEKVEELKIEKEDKSIAPYGTEWFMYIKPIGKLKDEYKNGDELI